MITALQLTKLIYAVLYVSLTRCHKTAVFTIYIFYFTFSWDSNVK